MEPAMHAKQSAPAPQQWKRDGKMAAARGSCGRVRVGSSGAGMPSASQGVRLLACSGCLACKLRSGPERSGRMPPGTCALLRMKWWLKLLSGMHWPMLRSSQRR